MKRADLVRLIACALLLNSTTAFAQMTSAGILDQAILAFAAQAASFEGPIKAAALNLFWTLGTISLVWTGGTLILRNADIGDFFAEFIRFCLFFGFFLWLLRNGPHFAATIIDSMQILGERASGASAVTPSGLIDVGFSIVTRAYDNLDLWNPVDSVIGFVLSLAVLVLLTLTALNVLLTWIAAWIFMYAGIFFLGFGGSRWTSDIAVSYFKTVIGIGAKLMTMILLIGISERFLDSYYLQMSKGPLNFAELTIMGIISLTVFVLIGRLPNTVGGVISGSALSSSFGIGNASVASAVSAISNAYFMASTAGSAVALPVASTKALFDAVRAGGNPEDPDSNRQCISDDAAEPVFAGNTISGSSARIDPHETNDRS